MDNSESKCICDEAGEEERWWTCPFHGKMFLNLVTGEVEQDKDEE